MHYLALVLIPNEGDHIDHVSRIMAPHQEGEDSEGHLTGFWDWWSIGGRWTGFLDGYDPEADPRNQEPSGRALWPTDWEPHAGDVQSADAVAASTPFGAKLPFALVWDGGALLQEVYVRDAPDGEHFPATPNFAVQVRDRIAAHDGRVVVVDYHC
jgi:hypothetical protein